MPGIGDELHHMGWNACSSCFDDAGMSREYLILPGVRSNNPHIVDTATDPVHGGLKINEDFIVDFGKEPNGPSRCPKIELFRPFWKPRLDLTI